MPVVAASIRVGVRVTRRNRQHLNGWNTRVRSAHDSVYKEIVKLSQFLTIGALHFYLAAKIVVGRNRSGPDHAEVAFAIRAHKHFIALHWDSWRRAFEQVGEAGKAVYFFRSDKSIVRC